MGILHWLSDLVNIITGLGVLAIAGVVFAESGLLIGFFLPGDSLLFTAGFLVHQDILHINISLFVLILFIAAALGDNAGYAFGNRVGRRLFRKKDSLLFRHENIERAEEFYEKYGSKTIILARFIPVVRTFAPIVAGIGKMRYATFFVFNLIGAFLWAVGVNYAGYFVGAWFKSRGIDIDHYLLPIILIIIILSILPPIIHILKDPKQRQAIVRSFRKTFGKKS
jgi:membrane-associated protein